MGWMRGWCALWASIWALGAAIIMVASPLRAAMPSADQAIVAIVNDDVISKRDLDARIDLVVATGNLENRPDVRQKIAPEVLRILIDDRLKQQESRRLNVTVTQRDTDRALTDIARQLNVEPARMPDYLQARGAAMTRSAWA